MDNLNKQDSVTSSRGSATFWCISSQTRAGNALSTLFVEPKLQDPDLILVRSGRMTGKPEIAPPPCRRVYDRCDPIFIMSEW
jgi:hypothetical protein